MIPVSFPGLDRRETRFFLETAFFLGIAFFTAGFFFATRLFAFGLVFLLAMICSLSLVGFHFSSRHSLLTISRAPRPKVM